MPSDSHELDFGSTIRGFARGQKLFGRYTLERILGRGGMGVVWLARDEVLGRETALKFLPEVVATDRAAVEDMKREVRRAIDLAHPHIVKIHDFVTDGTVAAVSMEYVAGQTLSAARCDEPGQVFTVEKLGALVGQLCTALDYAHDEAEVVHRDLKPANLMLDRRGRMKVLDFGIAASITDSVSRVSRQATGDGSLPYMSPQQLLGEKPAVTDDVYALGATLYELLTGKPPFFRGGATAIMHQIQTVLPPRMSERRAELGVAGEAFPEAWEETVAACLAKEAGARPQSAREVWERLSSENRKTSEKRETWESGKRGEGGEGGGGERRTRNVERRTPKGGGGGGEEISNRDVGGRGGGGFGAGRGWVLVRGGGAGAGEKGGGGADGIGGEAGGGGTGESAVGGGGGAIAGEAGGRGS